MTTLTSESTITIGASSVSTESTEIVVLAAAGIGEGTGRLVHPSLGAVDYPYMPDKWVNIDGDVIIPPVWSSAKTLSGAANTLFLGHIRDVVCQEIWDQEYFYDLDFLRTLVSFWMNPPDPSVAYVEWYPSYTTDLGYKVIFESITSGGDGLTLDYMSRQNVVVGPVVMRLRITGRV